MNIIFCGDRHWDNRKWIIEVMSKMKDELGEFTVIEGEAPGADLISKVVAELIVGLPYRGFPADWLKYDKAAGPIRNTQMLKEGKADAVVAFHLDLKKSKGTANMVDQALRAGIPVWVCTEGPSKLQLFIQVLRRKKDGIHNNI